MHLRALFILASFFLHALLQVVADVQVLNLNTDSTIYNDIKTIKHNAAERRVMIELHTHRRCDSPTFIVRLSGSALYKLAFDGAVNNTFSYSYPALVDPGKYFLEVVVLFCTAYNGDAPTSRALRMSTSAGM
jgi:hypothetical protein